MEDGLEHHFNNVADYKFSLNPCCNGRWSRTLLIKVLIKIGEVLILVVMEDGLEL